MLTNKNIKIIFKTVIGVGLFWWLANSLYYQIIHQPNLQETLQAIYTHWDSTQNMLLALVLLLMLANWSMEAIKWKMLIQSTEPISFVLALQSVLTGVSVSILTPNRIGEYVGRIMYLRNVNKLKGVTVTIIGSFAQLIITGVFGLLGLCMYLVFYNSSALMYVFLIVTVLLCVLLFILYFNLHLIYTFTQRVSFLRKLKIYIEIIQRFDKKLLLHLLFISGVRFLIYSIQFYVLLYLMHVNVPFVHTLFCIWLLFWSLAIIPSITIAEIGIRGKTALFILGVLSSNSVGILSANLLLWLINLIIPAIIGCFFVFRMRLYSDDDA